MKRYSLTDDVAGYSEVPRFGFGRQGRPLASKGLGDGGHAAVLQGLERAPAVVFPSLLGYGPPTLVCHFGFAHCNTYNTNT